MAAWNDYEEQRDLNLSASGIGTVDIDAGSGSLEISGVSGSNEIVVTATIQMPDYYDDGSGGIRVRGAADILDVYYWRIIRNAVGEHHE